MAITNTQQARQLYRIGGVGGRAKEGPVERPGGGGNGSNKFTQFTKENLNPQKDTVTQKFTGRSNLFGGANRFGYTDLRPDGSLKPGFGGRVFGGLVSLLTGIPVVGGAIGSMYDKGKGFFTPKKRDMSEFNKLGLYTDQFPTEDDDDEYDFSDIKDQEAKVVGLALAQKQNLEKKKRMEDFGGPKFTDEDQKVLDKLYEMDASEETFYQPVQRVADGGRIGLMQGGIMNPNIIGGEMDFESARQMYGLGKLVKKVTRTVKKIAKSPVGKAALLYTGAAGLGALGAGTGFAGFKSSLFSPSTILSNLAAGGRKLGILKTQFPAFSERVGPLSKLGVGSAILGASALAGLLTPEQEEEAQELARGEGIDIEAARQSILNSGTSKDFRALAFRAEGGPAEGKEPVAKKTMPLLDMGGKEMDLRAEGGFVPIGRMEKADDVPARLSKNEFVFTADAVRNAGDGDVDKGAEVMYNMMKNLEAGGDVSEESQGLEGARKMFQTSQRLEEVL